MNKGKITKFVYMLIFTWIAALAMICSVCDAFSIVYENVFFYSVSGIYTLLITAVLYAQKGNRLWQMAKMVFLAESVLVVIGRMKVIESLTYIKDTISVQFHAYLVNGRYAEVIKGSEQTWGLVFLGILFATISAIGIIYCKRVWFLSITMGLTFGLPFFVGGVPKKFTLVLVLLVIMGAVFAKTGGAREKEKLKAAILGICIGGLAFLIGIPLFSDTADALFQDKMAFQGKVDAFWNQNIREYLQNVGNGDRATGGVNDGKLGEYSGLDRDHSVHLKVKTQKKPEETIYIRGFVGSDYTGRSWKRGSERKFDSENDGFEVENVKANRKYQYHTYPDAEHIPDKWRKENSKYEKSVRKKYLEVPERIKESFADVTARNIVRTKPENVVNEVAYLLSHTARYSLNPGKTPEGKDFAEYFFFDKKEGYCTHFATTAVLLFRMEGIPSRYVGGYVARPKDFVKQKDGTYLAEITGEEAHAWAEIYVSGTGWIPAETTPGYVNENTSSDEQQNQTEWNTQEQENFVEPEDTESDAGDGQTEKQLNQKEDTEKEPEETDKSQVGRKEESGKKSKKSDKKIPSGVLILVIFLILSITVGGIIWIGRKNRERKEETEGYNEQTKRLFYKIYERLRAEKIISDETELEDELGEKLRKRCPQIKEEDTKKLLDIIYRANYGKDEIKREEYQFVRWILLLLEKKR